MKNTYLLLSLFLSGFLFSSEASLTITKARETSCLEKLTLDHNVDSQSFQISRHDYEEPQFSRRDYLAEAIFYIKALLKDMSCAKREYSFGEGPTGRSHSRCSLINRTEASKVCFVETNLGYFFVTYDYNENVNITFNRWD